jgi:anti-sigma factor RsiW
MPSPDRRPPATEERAERWMRRARLARAWLGVLAAATAVASALVGLARSLH